MAENCDEKEQRLHMRYQAELQVLNILGIVTGHDV